MPSYWGEIFSEGAFLMVRKSRNDFFRADVSSKKRMNEFDFNSTMVPQVDLLLFVFWRKLKRPRRHFEIIWPVVQSTFVNF